MQSRTRYYLVILLLMLLAVSGQIADPLTASANGSTNAVPVGDTYGSTYGEWSARWWQWLLSIPAATNPNVGGDCTQGQYDDVWFLPGTFASTATYECAIPAGKPLFFPLINNIAFKPYGYETLLDLRALAAQSINNVTDLQASIDGVSIPDLFKYRVRSPSFTIIPPAKGLLPPGQIKVPGNTDACVSDGYWLLIKQNWQAGSIHEIKFYVKQNDGSTKDVTYKLNVH
jgi:hypothetical protein